jgi:hypothetical protein
MSVPTLGRSVPTLGIFGPTLRKEPLLGIHGLILESGSTLWRSNPFCFVSHFISTAAMFAGYVLASFLHKKDKNDASELIQKILAEERRDAEIQKMLAQDAPRC